MNKDNHQAASGATPAASAHSGKEPTQKYDFSALLDALIVVIVLVAVKQFFLLYTIKFAGPISTFTAMFVATWRLRARGLTWAELGFRWPESWPKTLLWSAGAFVVIIGAGVVGNGVAELFFEKGYVANRFGDMEGNIPVFAMWLALIWTHGAFFEEMLFRAFLIDRLAVFLDGEKTATVLAVVLAAVFFGYRHAYYQGPFGFVVTGVIGLALGFFYIWLGRTNLWPQILAHGYMNTIGFTMRFLGLRE